jgi:glycosyltransferase involved in cell wall biosynthesis
VGRVLNEDDIVEAFVRHHMAYAERILLLDNGSNDRTLEILRALRAEGAPLTVVHSQAVFFNEQEYNTLLYRIADKAFTPDWVLHLDVDEFLDTRRGSLTETLAMVPPEMQAASFALWNYFANGLDASDLLVPRRMVMRDAEDRKILKCAIRGGLSEQITVLPGNHDAVIGGMRVATAHLPDLPLAHYSTRHPVQFIVKAALGRLKVLASGEPSIQNGHSDHYTHMLDALMRNPVEIFGNLERMQGTLPVIPLVEDPLHYAGSDLRYTAPINPIAKAIQSIANYASELAVSHGKLLDADPAARTRLVEASLKAEVIIV